MNASKDRGNLAPCGTPDRSAAGSRRRLASVPAVLVLAALLAARTAPAQYVVSDGVPTPAAPAVDGEMIEGPGSPGSFDAYAGEQVEGAVIGDGRWEESGGMMPAAPCEQCPQPGCPTCGPGPGLINRLLGPQCPRWVVQVDALMLWQGNIQSRPLFSGIEGQTLFNADQASTDVSPGPRVEIGRAHV